MKLEINVNSQVIIITQLAVYIIVYVKCANGAFVDIFIIVIVFV